LFIIGPPPKKKITDCTKVRNYANNIGHLQREEEAIKMKWSSVKHGNFKFERIFFSKFSLKGAGSVQEIFK